MQYLMNNGNIPLEYIEDLEKLLASNKPTIYSKGGHKHKVFELLGAFDTETSNVTVEEFKVPGCNDDVKLSGLRNVVYIWTFSLVDFTDRKNITSDNIQDKTLTLFGRTMFDFNELLKLLESEIQDIGLYIYVHNLNYDLDRVLNNCPWARDNLDGEESIIISAHTPLTVKTGMVYFKDSLKLFNAPLRDVGKQYGLLKIDYEYESVRLPESDLEEIDYTYNRNDCDIVLFALCRLCINNDIESVTRIPTTSTRLTVYRNEHSNDINPILKKTDRIRNRNGNLQLDKRTVRLSDDYLKLVKANELKSEDIPFFQQLFCGGYSHGSIFQVCRVMENVLSADFHSAYPGMMCSCKFPYDVVKVEYNVEERFRNYYERNNDYLNGVTPENIIKHHSMPCKTWFACTVTFKHLKVKVKNVKGEKWCSPVISISKCLNDMKELRRMVVDNGRLIEGENVTMEVNSIDLLAIQICYEDFEISNVTDLYVAGKQKPLHDYKLNTIKKWYTDKSGLKKLKKWCENPNRELTHDDFINSEYKLIDENAVPEYIEMSKDIKSFSYVIDDMYLRSKNCLNGQYGIMVMHINRDEVHIELLGDSYDYKGTGIKETKQKEIYIHGICITSYTRLHLLAFTHYLSEKCGILPIYWDTDSVKFVLMGTARETVYKEIDNYNTNVTKVRADLPKALGYMDGTDGYYDKFVFLGSKRYMYLEDGEVHITVAGLPKRNASKMYNDLYKELGNDFESVASYFEPNTFIDESATSKLLPCYFNPEKDRMYVKGDFYDDNGKLNHISENTGFLLVNAPFALVDLSKVENNSYYQLAFNMQGRFELLENEYPSQTILKKDGELMIQSKRILVPETMYYLRDMELFNE